MAGVRLTVLGSGTSVGVPTIGCDCKVCRSSDPRDNRLRPSVLVEWNGSRVVVDTTPDFRTQALRAGLDRIDAVLFTHAHADHIMGLDDIRPFNYRRRDPIPIYASESTLTNIRSAFRYIFELDNPESSIPKLAAIVHADEPFEVVGMQVVPVPVMHGRSRIYGFRFGDLAYLTDHSDIPPESLTLLEGLDVLFLDALRHKPHPTHSSVSESLRTVERLKPRQTYFTHICHDLSHEIVEGMLPPHVRLAYDGLVVETAGAGQ